MKKFKILDLIFVLFIFLLSCCDIRARNFSCIIFQDNEKHYIVEKAKLRSLKHKVKYYVEIFSSNYKKYYFRQKR